MIPAEPGPGHICIFIMLHTEKVKYYTEYAVQQYIQLIFSDSALMYL